MEPGRPSDNAATGPVVRRLGRAPGRARVPGAASAHRPGRFLVVPRLHRRRPGDQPDEREVAGRVDAPTPGRGHEGRRAGDEGSDRSTVGRARGARRPERPGRHRDVAGRQGRTRLVRHVRRPERPGEPGDRARRPERGRAQDLRRPQRGRGAGDRRRGLHIGRRGLLRERDGTGLRVRAGLLVPAAARCFPLDRHPDQGHHPQPAVDRRRVWAARARSSRRAGARTS